MLSCHLCEQETKGLDYKFGYVGNNLSCLRHPNKNVNSTLSGNENPNKPIVEKSPRRKPIINK